MAGPAIRGTGIIFGHSGHTFSGGVVSTGMQFGAMDFTRDCKVLDIPNSQAETIGKVFWDFKKTLRCTMVPSGTSRSAAVAAMAAGVVKAGVSVTVVSTDGVIAGTYNLLSAKMSRPPDGLVALDVEMENYDDYDVTTTIT